MSGSEVDGTGWPWAGNLASLASELYLIRNLGTVA
jgi:hypothetical protein